MIIYIDSNFRCHTTNTDGTFREIETSFFNGKCAAYIEGYCYDDSRGYPAIYPWKDYTELDAVQREYEREKLIKLESMQLELNSSYQEGINSI